MSVPVAYLGVILIWSTTPLAIQWSSEGGWLFGVAARMAVGALFCLALMGLLGIPLPRHRRALHAYVAAACGIFAAMLSVYWGAQFIPSGLISVLFGLTPMVTGVLAALWLGERALGLRELLGILVGLGGLLLVFGTGGALGPEAPRGVAAVLLSVCLHALSSVWVKRVGADIPALAQTAGGLLVSLPLYGVAWLLLGAEPPAAMSPRGWTAVAYLGLMGSVLGFVLYFYVLKQLAAVRIALVTLVTPVLALWIGHLFNGEALVPGVWAGTGLILGGLVLFEWGARRPVAVAEPG